MAATPVETRDLLASLTGAFTTLFVLSLAVERIAELFKHRDWQPLSLLAGRKVDLRTGLMKEGGAGDNPDEARHLERTAIAGNTFLIGILVAVATQANAFTYFVSLERWGPEGWEGVARAAFIWLQIALTGAAAGVGSSFWYDLLRLVAEIRRVKSNLATPDILKRPLRVTSGKKVPPGTDAPRNQVDPGKAQPDLGGGSPPPGGTGAVTSRG